MVDFMWSKGCPDSTLLLRVSVKVSLNDISIRTGVLMKAGGPPHAGEHLLVHGGPEQNREREEGGICPFLLPVCLLSWDIGLLLPLDGALRHALPWFLGFWTQTEVHRWLSWVYSLHVAYRGTSQSP